MGSVKEIILELDRPRCRVVAAGTPDSTNWWAFLNNLKDDLPARLDPAERRSQSPRSASSKRIGALTGPEGVYVAGVGQHQMWASQFIKYERPHAWLNSGGAGTMGYAVPAAMGAKVGNPTAWCGRSTATAASR